jgi:VanZ family protein
MNTSRISRRLARAVAAATRDQRIWQLLLLVLGLAVCYLAMSPAPPRTVDLGWDKLNHISAFAALAMAACFGFAESRRTLRWALLGLLAFGGLIEIVQLYVPGRSCEWNDLAADAIGVVIGAALALYLLRLRRRAAVPA